jgi:hypothetical protein
MDFLAPEKLGPTGTPEAKENGNMRIERIATSLLVAVGLFAASVVRAQQEPPPFPGGSEAQAPADASQGPVTDANTNDPAVAASTDYFHEQLAPYGQWVNHEGSGEVFVPKVAPGWRPYTAGHWAYTDQGWGWVADEPWGWAAFHYGRWDYAQDVGWAWTPGNVWAPAWVAWRSGGGYLGWAPLPSAIGFNAEEGLVGATGAITAGYFTFVAEQNILHPNIDTVILPSTRNVIIVSNTTNVTRYAVSSHGGVFNTGIDVHHIEKVIGRPVPQVRVSAMAQAGAHGRGAFYQPAVVTRAATRTRAEFGSALKSQRTTPSTSRVPRPDSARPSTAGTVRTLPSNSGTEPSRKQGYSSPGKTTSHPATATPRSTAPQPAPQSQPAAQPKRVEKPQPKKSDDKSKQKPPA